MAILPYLVMTDIQAARFRDETARDTNRLEPRLIEGGPHKGKYGLPARVSADPAHAARRDAFLMLQEVALDIEAAFPQPDE